MIEGIIFVLLASGIEVKIPSDKQFNTIEECQQLAAQVAPMFREQLGGKDVRFTCEKVE